MKKEGATKYCNSVFEKLMPQLAVYLNAIHEVEKSDLYWRIIVGPWLIHHIHACYLRHRGFGKEHQTLRPIWMDVEVSGPKQILRNTYAAILDLVGRTRPILICDIGMRHRDVWRICRASGFEAWPMIRRSGPYRSEKLNLPFRHKLELDAKKWGNDKFSHAISRKMYLNLPNIYLEGYSKMVRKGRPFLRGRQKILVSALGWKSNERFKFIAADAAERGATLVGSQHGAGTGVSLINPAEDFYRGYIDCFITWGIKKVGESEICVLPNPRIQGLIKSGNTEYKAVGGGLYVATSFPRYVAAGIRTQPMGNEVIAYMNWQKRFFAATDDIRHDFLVRLYPSEYGWNNKKELQDSKLGLRFDDFSKDIIYRMRESRLIIIDNPQTSFIEAMVQNRPCILFFDKDVWKMNVTARRKFEALSKVGIVQYSPESAAQFAKMIYAGPMVWWETTKVQKARQRFVNWLILEEEDWPYLRIQR